MHYQRALENGGDPGPAERLKPEYRTGCDVEGCEGKHKARGLCRRHDRQAKKAGGET